MAFLPTKLTQEVLSACFADDDFRDCLARRLESEIEEEEPGLAERIRLSIIRMIFNNHEIGDRTDDAMELAKSDWRDLFMAAGHGYDAHAHITWAESIIRDQPRISIHQPATLEAKMNDAGFVECPKCGVRFKTSDPRAWDGSRHRRCLQPIVLTQKQNKLW